MNNTLVSRRITIDLPEVPEWFAHYFIRTLNVLIHSAHDEHHSLAVMTIVPLEVETEGVSHEQEN